MTSPGLAIHISMQSERILDRWCEAALRDPDQPANRHGLRGEQLIDHLPSLLEALIRCLRDEDVGTVAQRGRDHGHQRRTVGYSVEELLDEMRLFRGVVMESTDDFHRQHGVDGVT